MNLPSASDDLALAMQYHHAGRLQEAEQIYRRILALNPNHPEALHLLGVIAHQAGRHENAIELIENAIRFHGTTASFHSNLGEAYRALGRYPEAIACYQRALQLKPDFALAHNNLGLALQKVGRLDDAVTSFQQALALEAGFVTAYNNLGNAWSEQGRHGEASACYRRALELMPDSVDTYLNWGNALHDQGQLPESIACYQKALALKPDHAGAYLALGNSLHAQGQLNAAVACYERALVLDPSFADAHNNLGTVFQDQGQLARASACYQRALELKPDLAGAHNNLANVWKDQGLIRKAIASYRQALNLNPGYAKAHGNLAYALYFSPDYDAQAIFAEHRRWNEQHARPLAKTIEPHPNDRSPNRRSRIGYVSPDFSLHPVGRFLLPLLQTHDHESFEIFCYASVRAPDEITQQSRAHADVWRDVLGVSDEEVARIIRKDRIDILVDLSMHMAGNRLLVFARKPAPVQVTYLAYGGTTGLDAMDYRLTDPYLDRPLSVVNGQSSVVSGPLSVVDCQEQRTTDYGQRTTDYCHSEESIWLPQTYWCYQCPCATPAVNCLPALEANRVTFGCLNSFSKVTEPTLVTWSRLLQLLPDARLLLHAHSGAHRDRVRDFFSGHQVATERITFIDMLAMPEYFKVYAQMDVALDPFPYGGGTTTCDALWMGVPVVSLVGQTAVGRAGLSILSNVGLADLVAHDAGHYVEIAVGLASDLPRLSTLRAGLRQQVQASPLMDAPRFARAVEAAYRDMWQRWCATSTGQFQEKWARGAAHSHPPCID